MPMNIQGARSSGLRLVPAQPSSVGHADGTRDATPKKSIAFRVGAALLREFRHILPPTLFFFVGFHLIVYTKQLILAEHQIQFTGFMIATVAALVVGKAVLVADKMPFLSRFDRAPLIQPILFKTAVYWVFVFLARLLEAFIHSVIIDGDPPDSFFSELHAAFSWHRFIAVQLWILVLF